MSMLLATLVGHSDLSKKCQPFQGWHKILPSLRQDLAVLHHLSSLSVLTSHHIAAVLEQFEDLSLRNDPGAVGLLRHLLQHLDQGLG